MEKREMQTTKKQKSNVHRTLKELIKIYGFGFLLGAVILLVAYQFIEPSPPRELTIATASKDGAYYSFAQRYKSKFADLGITLKVLETSGSVENLDLLSKGQVELAFLQGGIASSDDFPEIRGLASVYLEPLWIFARRDLPVNTLHDLKGRRVGIGEEGSGTRKITQQLLDDNQLTDKLEMLPLGAKKGAQQLLQNEIDALFVVTRAGSEIVQNLLSDSRVDLISLRRTEAYTRLHSYLSHVLLPEGTLDLANNLPDRDIHLVAPAATLVAGENMHPALIDLVMQIMTSIHKDGAILTPNHNFPSPDYLDFELSREAERYFKHGPPFLQRYLPFWAASLVDRLKFMLLPLVALILPLMKILPPTYRWRIRSKIYRWYDQLHELDLYVRDNRSKENVQQFLGVLDEMEDEVRQVEVPLSYAEELYHLRLHIDLLRSQLTRRA